MARLPKLALLLGGLLFTTATAVSFQSQADKDRRQLQGKWEIVSLMSRAGKEEPKPGRMLCLINGNKLISKEGATVTGEALFSIDTGKSPRTIDLRITAGEDKGKSILGIYELKGQDLKMCMGSPNGPRPTEFVPLPNQSLIIMKKGKN